MRHALTALAVLALALLAPTAPTVAHDPSFCEGGPTSATDVRVDSFDFSDLTGLLDTTCFNGNANGGAGEVRNFTGAAEDDLNSASMRYIGSQGNGAMLVIFVDTDTSPDNLRTFCLDNTDARNHYHWTAGTDFKNKVDKIHVEEAGGCP